DHRRRPPLANHPPPGESPFRAAGDVPYASAEMTRARSGRGARRGGVFEALARTARPVLCALALATATLAEAPIAHAQAAESPNAQAAADHKRRGNEAMLQLQY